MTALNIRVSNIYIIFQGYYQAARQLLNEAFLAAKAFEDKQTEAHIVQNLAMLACQEGNFGLAVNMLKEAQVRDHLKFSCS